MGNRKLDKELKKVFEKLKEKKPDINIGTDIVKLYSILMLFGY